MRTRNGRRISRRYVPGQLYPVWPMRPMMLTVGSARQVRGEMCRRILPYLFNEEDMSPNKW